MRFRRPGLKTLLGVTAAKQRVKRSLGISRVTGILNAPKNAERRARRALGWESGVMKWFRLLRRLFR